MQSSDTRTCDLRPGFFEVVKGNFAAFLETPNCAENLRAGWGEFCGRTRLFALDFAESRDLLDLLFGNGFVDRPYNTCISLTLLALAIKGKSAEGI